MNFRFETLRITQHAQDRLHDRGFTAQAIKDALDSPDLTYAAKDDRYPGQYRVVKGPMVVVVDSVRRSIPTVFFHGKTDYRTA